MKGFALGMVLMVGISLLAAIVLKGQDYSSRTLNEPQNANVRY